MTELFNKAELDEFLKKNEENPVSPVEIMAVFIKYNQAAEECTKLFSSDSPYMGQFYINLGFNNLFNLYHFLRAISPIIESKLLVKRIGVAKHVQLLWSNIGDVFATVIESKFIKEAREVYALVTPRHKTENELLSSIYFHICTEIFKQDDIINFFLHNSKFFLECLIDVMKLMITEEDIGNSARNAIEYRDNRLNRFGDRYGGRADNLNRQQQVEHDQAAIANLTALGFTMNRAREALDRTHGSVELSAEYLLSLPPEVLREVEEETIAAKDKSGDKKMESEENKDGQMAVDFDGVYVKTPEELAIAIKDWLGVLYNWIIQGFNSSLTEVDIDNITQFILKYISKDFEVKKLMMVLLESLARIAELFENKENLEEEKRKQELHIYMKKGITVSKIISHLSKYFFKNIEFIEEVMGVLEKLFESHKDLPFNFGITPEERIIDFAESTEKDPELIRFYKDIIDNCLNILISAFGFYKLAQAEEVESFIKEELKVKDKEEEEKMTDKDKKKDESKPINMVEKYFKEIQAFETPEEFQINLKKWKEGFNKERFLKLSLLMLQHSQNYFDQCFKNFNKFMFFLYKQIEDEDVAKAFVEEGGFKLLLNLKSTKRKIIDNSKSYFYSIAIKLIEDESAFLVIAENIIKKCLFFKHDEEFSKEMKEKAKENAPKKKKDKSKDHFKQKDEEEKKKPEEDKKIEEEKKSAKKADLHDSKL
jgi:hypothetical protein